MNILSQFKLTNKIIVITGGSGYLGSKITEGLADAEAIVVVTGKDKKEFDSAFSKNQKKIFFQEMDISSTTSIKKAFKTIASKYKKIDTLINCAFYTRGKYPDDMIDDDWNHGIDGTLNSVFRCTREVLPYMKKACIGSIINISSMYGIVSPDFNVYKEHPEFFNPPNYGAAKAGVIQLTKYFATYLAPENIRVNCVSPGAFPSKNVQKTKKFITNLSDKIPFKRIGNPEELKGVFVFLASEASSYITGQNIIVDGGWTLW